ncbi:MAG: hypothetical protein QM831_15505 [Kofleriaceae bacterium]
MPFANGSRLAVYNYLLSDGTRVPIPYDFFDKGRGEFCDLQTWSDGATYCTPSYTVPVYRDANCSQQMIRRINGDSPVSYSRDVFIAATGAHQISKLRSIGAPITDIDQYFELSGDGSCTGPYANATYYELGTETVGSDAFVRVRTLPDPTDDRLAQIKVRGDDGLVVAKGFHDNDLDLDCVITGTSPCLPFYAATAAYWTDAACTMPAFPQSQGGEQAVYEPGPGCGTYYAITATDAGSALFDGGAANCTPAVVDVPSYKAGDKLELATHDRVRLETPTRYQRYQIGDQIDSIVFDTELGVDCTVGPEGCFPASVGIQVAYSDRGCTTPVSLAIIPDDNCGEPPTYAADQTGYYPIGDVYTGGAYIPSTGDTCIALQSPGGQFHTLGAPIAVDAFGGPATFVY